MTELDLLHCYTIETSNTFFLNNIVTFRHKPGEEINGMRLSRFDPVQSTIKFWYDFIDEDTLKMDVFNSCKNITKSVDEINCDMSQFRWQLEPLSNVLTSIMKARNEIAISTYLGMGNLFVMNNKFWNYLSNITDNFMTIHPIMTDITDHSFKLAGTLECIKLSINDHSNYAEGIMTYHHQNVSAGMLFNDREHNKYAIVNDFIDTNKFYKLIRLVKNELQ